MDKKIESLIKLLDDDNQQTASLIMAELLCHEEELDPVIMEFQEAEDPRMRRRIHQLQSVLKTRRNRRNFAKRLKSDDTDLFEGLSELHFLWYDNDFQKTITQYWDAIIENSKKYHPETIDKIGHFMRKYGFRTSSKDDIEADYYSLGITLEELIGADFILCVIAQKLAAHWGLKLEIIYLIGDFALIDDKGQVLFPKNFWKMLPQIKKGTYSVWSSKQILRMATSMLFTCATSTDSFRYIYSIGNVLAKSCDVKDLSSLPFPYNIASKK